MWDRINDVFHRVTREVVANAESVENPVLVLKDMTHIRKDIDCGEYNRRFNSWGFGKLHAQIRYEAAEMGYLSRRWTPEHIEGVPRLQ